MTELVAHKGKISFAAQTHSDQPQHLVQGHAPVDDHIFHIPGHMGVHFLVAQPEHNGLVAYQCLVMGFAVANDLFVAAADGKLVIDLIQIPMLVRHFL